MAEPATTPITAPDTPAASPAAPETDAPAAAPAQEGHQEGKASDFEALVQRAVDRATNKLGNENKRLRSEIETLKKAKLSDDEIKQIEMQEKEKEIAEREKALSEKENRLLAIKAIKEAGLDDGSDASLAIVDFVMADSEEGIRDRVKAFDALVKRIVQSQVDAVFKANGRTPGVGTDTASAAGGQNESIAVRMGRNAAATNQASRAILDKYIGGK